MNELAELSMLRADAPAGDEQGLAHPRELLQAEIRAAREGGAGSRARDGAPPALLRRPRRAIPRHLPTLPWALSPRLRNSLAGGATVAAALAVTAGLLGGPGQAAGGRATDGTAHPAGSTDVTAAYVLDRAAATVADARQPAPQPGQYISMSSVATSMGAEGGERGQITRSWLMTSGRQIWLSASGRTQGALHIHVTGEERLPWGGVPPDLPGRRRVVWMTVPASTCPASTQGTYPYLASLPIRPARLRAWIYAHLAGGKLPANDQAWKEITSLLGTMPVPPKLAAALFRVAAAIPGARVVGHATDAAGRDGIAVARSDRTARADVELIFDPVSYRFLGERTVLAAPVPGVGPAGTVIESTAVLGVTIVDHAPHHGTAVRGGASTAGC